MLSTRRALFAGILLAAAGAAGLGKEEGAASRSGAVQSWAAPAEEKLFDGYTVRVNGQAVPVYACRVSAMPFNQVWPGYQRPLDQTELAGFAYWGMSGPVRVEVISKRPFKSVAVRPGGAGHPACRERPAHHLRAFRPGPVYGGAGRAASGPAPVRRSARGARRPNRAPRMCSISVRGCTGRARSCSRAGRRCMWRAGRWSTRPSRGAGSGERGFWGGASSIPASSRAGGRRLHSPRGLVRGESRGRDHPRLGLVRLERLRLPRSRRSRGSS